MKKGHVPVAETEEQTITHLLEKMEHIVVELLPFAVNVGTRRSFNYDRTEETTIKSKNRRCSPKRIGESSHGRRNRQYVSLGTSHVQSSVRTSLHQAAAEKTRAACYLLIEQ